jgi:hypothetical protein
MRVKSRLLQIFVSSFLTASLIFVGPPSTTANQLQNIDEIKVGIVGKTVVGYGCWPTAAKGRKAELQVRVMGQWVSKARTKVYRNDLLCPGEFTAMYSWRVDEFGESQNSLSPRGRDTFFRQHLPKTKKSKAITRDAFLITIYKSELDQALDFNDILKSILNSGM